MRLIHRRVEGSIRPLDGDVRERACSAQKGRQVKAVSSEMLSSSAHLRKSASTSAKKIAIIATGGTIGSRSRSSGIGTLSQQDRAIDAIVDRLRSSRLNLFRGLREIPIDVTYPFTLLSENIIPSDWGTIARSIEKEVNRGATGVVVTHGTDTMAYSLSAISFMMSNISVPIVFTGAMRTSDDQRSDADVNLAGAIQAAAKIQYPGVYLAFSSHNRRSSLNGKVSVYWGVRVRSVPTFGDHFDSIDGKEIAYIHDGNLEMENEGIIAGVYMSGTPPAVDDRVDDRVGVAKVYPGFNPEMLRSSVHCGSQAVIIDLYHSGTACARKSDKSERYSISGAISYLKSKDIAVFGVGAPYHRHKQYQSTSSLVGSGLHPLGAITLEAAVVKAMCLLGRGVSTKDLASQMDIDTCGEFCKEGK